jgi:glycopeptide antibiotics resistance protein
MYRFYLAAVDMLPAALLLAPVYLVLNKAYFHNARKSILYFLFACYLSVLYVLVGLPNVTYIRPEINLNVVPIIGMIEDWKNSILNILLFIPLGVALPVLWNKFRTKRNSVLFGFAVSFVIELLQILTYRATDINDLITNTLGTYLGFLCTKCLLKKHQIAGENRTREAGIVTLSVLLVMFFVYPFVSSALWDLILS